MKTIAEKTEKLISLAPEVGGVFSLMELSSLFDISEPQKLWKAIRLFEDAGLLSRYSRGIYTAKEFDPQILFAKVRGDSYISLGSALAAHRLIGTESPKLVTGLVPAKAKEYGGIVNLSYSRISQDLFFGFGITDKGIRMADPEKAVLDTLYFYLRGKKYHFNVFQDIQFSILSKKKIEVYLKSFKNPKFQTFARGVING